MGFEFNTNKSKDNDKKHGIDFEQAQQLWNDPDCIIIRARTSDEPRFLLIGKYDGKIWSAIFTIRTEKIRLISVRRSIKNEKEIYNS